MRVLVTGNRSGLGRFLFEGLGADGFNRKNNIDELLRNKAHYDVIIHCAFNLKNKIHLSEYGSYLNDTIFLAEKLSSIPHKKFIFFSTIDVYPKSLNVAAENSDFTVSDVEGIYAHSKLLCETIVKKNSKDCAILRLSALLGKYSRKNSLIKILTEKNAALTLSPESTFNYVLHDDILVFIKEIISQNLNGTYNLCASSNISLKEVVDHFEIAKVSFGNFIYKTLNVPNQKVALANKVFQKTSLENIEIFKKNYLKIFTT